MSGTAFLMEEPRVSRFKGLRDPGVRMRSGMRMRTHRMREILLNADKDANAFDEI